MVSGTAAVKVDYLNTVANESFQQNILKVQTALKCKM